jgi:dihydroxy-acid dehydratase
VKHMQAVASEAVCAVDVYGLFEKLADETPVLTAVRPVGEHTIEEFEAAGGCRAVLKQLEPLLNGNVLTVTGKTLQQNLEKAVIENPEIVRPLSRPIATKPAIVLVRGSLAPDAGIVKVGIDPHKKRRFEGKAICFSTSDEALAGIKGGAIKPGHVVVMRGAGVCGGPGMGGGASRVVFALDGAGLGEQVALLTDGHLSGLVCKGLVVGEVAPEAAAGGPLALVEDGDRIVIDLEKRVCDLEVAQAELDARRARWQAPRANYDSGWLRIYQRNVGSLAKGGVLTGEK